MDPKVRLGALIVLSVVAVIFVGAQTQPSQPQTPTQKAESGEREVGRSYATLRPEQKRLVDDFVMRYNRVTGSDLLPEHAYDKARLSVRTTFDAVTHALLNAKITDSMGKDLGHAIDLVEAIDEVMGEEASRSAGQAYNPYTGTYAATRQGS
jgi:hypothetical protein